MRPDAVRLALDTELAAVRRRHTEPPRVLDVGGGSGVWAVPLAAAGCLVTVVDPSPNALATLQRRAVEAGVADLVTAVQGDTDALADLVPAGGADLVLGHGVLEVVDDLRAALAQLAGAATPGGAVSVLVANRYAALINRVLAGRLVDARQLLDDPDGQLPGDPLQRRFDVDSLRSALSGAGLDVELLQGYGVVADLVPGAVLEGSPGAAEALAQLEVAAATQPPLRDVASRLHALARRP
ncbi:class I SAM-dependent methyltransferase [Kutzneria sp. CA-103260]|uniref:class I SAM-dependent methyltransferase n=1 Tax=Kutzneria sp. CA-103260 TaxID=2802641 RepID=UPI001BAC9DED|nr:methyltransferase domain-containing protein [Kutzneria sp. CA-103260]QUQ71660.1 methyltransferase [Kutzneria sp. CA-103260]